ncbi:MAG TPA: hypothetical protein VKC54_04690 [Patescibacteria group bacterium]|nr:hypothetical protein [Patescibacteria group bacterium]
MPIEIDLGDWGTLSFDRLKTKSSMLSDLGKDRKAIELAIRKYADNKEVVFGGEHIGDKNFVPTKFLLVSFTDTTSWPGGDKMFRKLFIDLEGQVIEEYRVGEFAMSNRETDPFRLPSWVDKAVTPRELQTRITKLFYPEKLSK